MLAVRTSDGVQALTATGDFLAGIAPCTAWLAVPRTAATAPA